MGRAWLRCAVSSASAGLTGYKIYDRYKDCGLEGLTDRTRTPYRYANKIPAQLEAMIVSMRREKLTWGARKLISRGYAHSAARGIRLV